MSKIDQTFIDSMEAQGYRHTHRLLSGEFAGLLPMLGSWGLFVGMEDFGYRCWYSYPDYGSAVLAITEWSGYGDPPGGWIKQKGRDLAHGPVDRLNPNFGQGRAFPKEKGREGERAAEWPSPSDQTQKKG